MSLADTFSEGLLLKFVVMSLLVTETCAEAGVFLVNTSGV
jgi:hypothetical protein